MRVDLDQSGPALGFLCCQHCRSTAAERIEHELALVGAVLQGVRHHSDPHFGLTSLDNLVLIAGPLAAPQIWRQLEMFLAPEIVAPHVPKAEDEDEPLL